MAVALHSRDKISGLRIWLRIERQKSDIRRLKSLENLRLRFGELCVGAKRAQFGRVWNCRFEAHDDYIGPEQVVGLEFAVRLMTYLGRVRGCQTAEADEALGFHRADRNGERELFDRLGIRLEEDEDAAHGFECKARHRSDGHPIPTHRVKQMRDGWGTRTSDIQQVRIPARRR